MSSTTIVVRPATEQDVDALVEFNCNIARETENKELCRTTVRRGVEGGLTCAGEVTYYLAEITGEVVGCLMLTREWSDWRSGWLIWIQSVYVRDKFRSRGVFRQLLSRVEADLAERTDVVGLRLYVEQENETAQEVYRRCGFVDPNYKVLEKPLKR